MTPVCFEFNAARNYNVDPEWVGKEAARLAVSALKTKSVETKNYKLIFTQFALQELLYYTLINAVKADNVERNQSPFKDKLGRKWLLKPSQYTMTACSQVDYARAFDGEGVPHQKTPS